MIPAGSNSMFRSRPANIRLKLGTESCDSSGKTYPFESYGRRTEVWCSALCGAPLHCRSENPGVTTPPGISGFIAGPAAGVAITLKDNSGRVVGRAATDGAGRYSVGGLADWQALFCDSIHQRSFDGSP